MKDNIILMGFMGCGKTSIGIRLSDALKRTVVDTDQYIEQKQNKTISRIFASEGEAAFRQMETQCLKDLIQSVDGLIISIGGGLPIRQENHALLAQLGKVIYLKATPEAIYDRLKSDTTRPLLQVDNPQAKIREMIAQREPIYAKCADWTVEVSGQTLDEIVELIIAQL